MRRRQSVLAEDVADWARGFPLFPFLGLKELESYDRRIASRLVGPSTAAVGTSS